MKYRSTSRAIGILHFVLSIIGALVVLTGIFFLVFECSETTDAILLIGGSGKNVSNTTSDFEDKASHTAILFANKTLVVVILWIGFVLLGLIILLHNVASWNLIKGTEMFVSPSTGLRCCRIWRGVTIFFVVVQILTLTAFSYQRGIQNVRCSLSFVFPVIYLISLYFVQQYMNELSLALATMNGVAKMCASSGNGMHCRLY